MAKKKASSSSSRGGSFPVATDGPSASPGMAPSSIKDTGATKEIKFLADSEEVAATPSAKAVLGDFLNLALEECAGLDRNTLSEDDSDATEDKVKISNNSRSGSQSLNKGKSSRPSPPGLSGCVPPAVSTSAPPLIGPVEIPAVNSSLPGPQFANMCPGVATASRSFVDVAKNHGSTISNKAFMNSGLGCQLTFIPPVSQRVFIKCSEGLPMLEVW